MQYEVKCKPFPVVVCNMANGEKIKCQRGAMAWMTPNMSMETKTGGLGKMFSKALTGESLFENVYEAKGDGMIAFTSGVIFFSSPSISVVSSIEYPIPKRLKILSRTRKVPP